MRYRWIYLGLTLLFLLLGNVFLITTISSPVVLSPLDQNRNEELMTIEGTFRSGLYQDDYLIITSETFSGYQIRVYDNDNNLLEQHSPDRSTHPVMITDDRLFTLPPAASSSSLVDNKMTVSAELLILSRQDRFHPPLDLEVEITIGREQPNLAALEILPSTVLQSGEVLVMPFIIDIRWEDTGYNLWGLFEVNTQTRDLTTNLLGNVSADIHSVHVFEDDPYRLITIVSDNNQTLYNSYSFDGQELNIIGSTTIQCSYTCQPYLVDKVPAVMGYTVTEETLSYFVITDQTTRSVRVNEVDKQVRSSSLNMVNNKYIVSFPIYHQDTGTAEYFYVMSWKNLNQMFRGNLDTNYDDYTLRFISGDIDLFYYIVQKSGSEREFELNYYILEGSMVMGIVQQNNWIIPVLFNIAGVGMLVRIFLRVRPFKTEDTLYPQRDYSE